MMAIHFTDVSELQVIMAAPLVMDLGVTVAGFK